MLLPYFLIVTFVGVAIGLDTFDSLLVAGGKCAAVVAAIGALPAVNQQSASNYCNAYLSAIKTIAAPTVTVTVGGICTPLTPTNLSIAPRNIELAPRGFVRSVGHPCPAFMTALGTKAISQVCSCLTRTSSTTTTPRTTITLFNPVISTTTSYVIQTTTTQPVAIQTTITIIEAPSIVPAVIYQTVFAPANTTTIRRSTVAPSVSTTTGTSTVTYREIVETSTTTATSTITTTTTPVINIYSILTRTSYTKVARTTSFSFSGVRTVSVVAKYETTDEGEAVLCRRAEPVVFPTDTVCRTVVMTLTVTKKISLTASTKTQIVSVLSTPVRTSFSTSVISWTPSATTTVTVTATPVVATIVTRFVIGTDMLSASPFPSTSTRTIVMTASSTITSTKTEIADPQTTTTVTGTTTVSTEATDTIYAFSSTMFITVPGSVATIPAQMDLRFGHGSGPRAPSAPEVSLGPYDIPVKPYVTPRPNFLSRGGVNNRSGFAVETAPTHWFFLLNNEIHTPQLNADDWRESAVRNPGRCSEGSCEFKFDLPLWSVPEDPNPWSAKCYISFDQPRRLFCKNSLYGFLPDDAFTTGGDLQLRWGRIGRMYQMLPDMYILPHAQHC
ncbi:hypothetical protein PYCC9005_005869 [Savitreella phatthalungensis]